MNILKQLFIVLVTSIVLGILSVASVSAQTQQKLMVAVTPYKPFQNLDFFFLNSVAPLYYIESEKPVFVAMINPEQKKAYERAGYQPKIVDEEAGALTQYYIMSTHHHKTPNIAKDLQKPEYKKQGLELAYELETYTTLLKVSKDTSFSQLGIALLEPFNARQLHWNLVPPTGRTSKEVQEKFPFSPQGAIEKNSQKQAYAYLTETIVAVAVLTALILLAFFLKRKRK